MKKLLLRILLITCIVSMAGVCARAASWHGADFLLIDPSARAVGMGSCFTGIANDISSMYWNPAGLNSIRNNEVLMSRNQWLSGTEFNYFGYAENLNKIGTLGLGLAMLNYGTIAGRGADGYTINNFSAYDGALTLSYANDLGFMGLFGRSILFGINLKIIRQMIGDYTANGVAFDAGMIYRTHVLKDLSLGFAVRNVGTDMKFINNAYSLPLVASFGGSCRLVKNLTTAIDLQYYKHSNDMKLSIGIEYSPQFKGNVFMIRSGYQVLLNNNDGLSYGNNAVSDLTFGAGFKMGDYELDYAFVPFRDFEQVHRISFIWKCDEPVLRSWVEKIFGGFGAINKFVFTKLVESIGFVGKAAGVIDMGSRVIPDTDEIGELPDIEIDSEFLEIKK